MTQTSTGQISAPIAMAARIAAIGRSKNGRMLPSDLISEVTNACSTMVPIDDAEHHGGDRIAVLLHDVADHAEGRDGDDAEHVVAGRERADARSTA